MDIGNFLICVGKKLSTEQRFKLEKEFDKGLDNISPKALQDKLNKVGVSPNTIVAIMECAYKHLFK